MFNLRFFNARITILFLDLHRSRKTLIQRTYSGDKQRPTEITVSPQAGQATLVEYILTNALPTAIEVGLSFEDPENELGFITDETEWRALRAAAKRTFEGVHRAGVAWLLPAGGQTTVGFRYLCTAREVPRARRIRISIVRRDTVIDAGATTTTAAAATAATEGSPAAAAGSTNNTLKATTAAATAAVITAAAARRYQLGRLSQITAFAQTSGAATPGAGRAAG